VACDRSRPRCQACSSSGRECLGYGLKLSWPRHDDKKRAIVLEDSAQLPYSSVLEEFVRVSNIDIELYKNRHPRETESLNISMFDMDMYNNFPNANDQSTAIRDGRHFRTKLLRSIFCPIVFFSATSETYELTCTVQVKVAPCLTSANSAVIQNLIFRMCDIPGTESLCLIHRCSVFKSIFSLLLN
jgi:hypothetical protein